MNKITSPSNFKYSTTFLIGTMILLTGLTFLGQIGFLVAIILVVLIVRYQKQSLQDIGLGRPRSWVKTFFISLILALAILALFLFVLNPIMESLLSLEAKNIDRFSVLKENLPMLMLGIVSAIITAGFGEEIIWRGYILKHFAHLLGNRRSSWFWSLLLTSIVFGLLHSYQGSTGMAQTGITGFLLGVIYIMNGKKNLWINIFTHSIINIISLTAIYLGMV